ncbi:MAG: hypothetical protein GC145_03415 [Caulobacter sp.]|nr:hypothetical protein [Caulobacter sp.]
MNGQFLRWALKSLALVGLTMSLGACNLVITTEPTFETVDAAGAARLRTGLWVNLDAGCDVDLKTPASGWPECANWVVVKDDALSGTGDNGKPFSAPYILAAGDPRVMQLTLNDPDSNQTLYLYLGVLPAKVDGDGKIVEYSGWIVQCGPPPPKDAKKPDGTPRFGTLKPFPGMIMDEQQSGCQPADKAALIKAAGLSKAYDTDNKDKVNRWVRDGDN